MRIRFLAAVVGALLVAGCGGGDDQPQAAGTTTSTTAPDPAMAACAEHVSTVDVKNRSTEGDEALDQLTLSRDTRIAQAAVKVDSIIRDRAGDVNAVPPDLDLEYAEAELELARACKAAGYLTG
jgi:hypothetical protein